MAEEGGGVIRTVITIAAAGGIMYLLTSFAVGTAIVAAFGWGKISIFLFGIFTIYFVFFRK